MPIVLGSSAKAYFRARRAELLEHGREKLFRLARDAAIGVMAFAQQRGWSSEFQSTVKALRNPVRLRIESPYAEYLENGTQPHDITPKNASVLHFVVNGNDVFARKVHHPGTKALKFVENSVNEALSYFIG